MLTALYRTNPIIPEDGGFDLTYDYPKREVEDYRFAVENRERPEAVVVDCLYELDSEDKAVVSKIFGPKRVDEQYISPGDILRQAKREYMFSSPTSTRRASILLGNPEFPDGLQESLETTADWQAFAALLEEAEANDAVTACKEAVAKVTEHGLASYIFKSLIWPRARQVPLFRRILPDERAGQSRCAESTRR